MEEWEIRQLASQAAEALRQGRIDEGLEVTRRLVLAQPANPVYRCWRVHVLIAQRKFRQAMAEARTAVELGPGMYQTHLAMACVATAMGRNNAAQDAFEKALAISDNDPYLLSEYAHFMAGRRAPKVAEKAARRVLQTDPNSADGHAALGLALFRQNRYDEAETQLRKALDIDPRCTRGQTYLAALMRRTGRQSQEKDLSRVLQDNLYEGDFSQMIVDRDRQREVIAVLYDHPVVEEADAPAAPPRPKLGAGRWILSAALAGMTAGGVAITLLAETGSLAVLGYTTAATAGGLLMLLLLGR